MDFIKEINRYFEKPMMALGIKQTIEFDKQMANLCKTLNIQPPKIEVNKDIIFKPTEN